MGRKKLRIKRLENVKDRQAKYSKRKIGILKKANELSVLCNVDLALIMFSPSGKPSLYVGLDKELLDVVDKLARVFVEDRERRRSYTMKLLQKLYANTDVDLNNFSLDRSDFLKSQQNHLRELNRKIDEKTKILSEWKQPQNITDLQQIQTMENHLALCLENIRAKKRELLKQKQEQVQGLQAYEGEPII